MIFLSNSLQLSPKHFHSCRIILPNNPTNNIPHKLNRFKVILPVQYYYEETKQEIITQKQIQQKQLGCSLENYPVLVDLKFTEL